MNNADRINTALALLGAFLFGCMASKIVVSKAEANGKSIDQWEYACAELSEVGGVGPELMEQTFNQFGLQGWRLVMGAPQDMYCFRRSLEPGKQPVRGLPTK